MYDFHIDKKQYFDMQTINAASSVIPFIKQQIPSLAGMNVLEVGSAEGGVLRAFIQEGCSGVGVELVQSRKEDAEQFMKEEIATGKCIFYNKNIYDPLFESEFYEKFDLIVLKDVIEHIHDQDKIMIQLKKFLIPGGRIFFGFPPWYMPFGGHQQICQSSFLSKLPYFHLLPKPIYGWILKIFGENPADLLEIKDTGISTQRFEAICRNTSLTIELERHYLINPIYEYKFGLRPKLQYSIITKIPFFRDFVTTCVFYLVRKDR